MTKSARARWLRRALRLGLGLVWLLPLALSASLASGEPAYSLYLPLVQDKPCPPHGPGIFGCVEFNGLRLGGFTVTLTRQYNANPQPPAIAGTTVTDANGYFEFDNLPPVSGPDYYYAGYRNTTNPTQLHDRDQPFTYAGGQWDLGTWDVTNIPLVQPADGLHVTLPYTFTWGLRSSSPADYYVLVIYGQGGSFDYFQQGTGHQASDEVSSLPTGFDYGQEYLWEVRNQPAFPFEPILEDSFQTLRVTFDGP